MRDERETINETRQAVKTKTSSLRADREAHAHLTHDLARHLVVEEADDDARVELLQLAHRVAHVVREGDGLRDLDAHLARLLAEVLERLRVRVRVRVHKAISTRARARPPRGRALITHYTLLISSAVNTHYSVI